MDGDRDVSVYCLARRAAGFEMGGLLRPQASDARVDAARPGESWARVHATSEPALGRKFSAAS